MVVCTKKSIKFNRHPCGAHIFLSMERILAPGKKKDCYIASIDIDESDCDQSPRIPSRPSRKNESSPKFLTQRNMEPALEVFCAGTLIASPNYSARPETLEQ